MSDAAASEALKALNEALPPLADGVRAFTVPYAQDCAPDATILIVRAPAPPLTRQVAVMVDEPSHLLEGLNTLVGLAKAAGCFFKAND